MHGVNPTPFHTFALRLAAPRGSNITLERKKLGPIFRVARAGLGRKGDRFQVLQHVTPPNSTKFTKLPDGKTTISHSDKGDGVAQNSVLSSSSSIYHYSHHFFRGSFCVCWDVRSYLHK